VVLIFIASVLSSAPAAASQNDPWVRTGGPIPVTSPPPGGIGISGFSCPTPTFCAAITSTGYAALYRNGHWSELDQISDASDESNPDDAGSGSLSTISCASASFCMAVGADQSDTVGEAYIYSGSRWSNHIAAPASTTSLGFVACPTSSWCMTTDDAGNVFTYSHGVFSGPTQVTSSSSDPLESLTCPTRSFCLGLGQPTDAYTYSSGHWSGPHVLDAKQGDDPGPAWCVSVSSCLASNARGNTYAYASGHWRSAGRADHESHGFLGTLACESPSLCVASATTGTLVSYNGTVWSTAAHLGGAAVYCGTNYCVALSGTGQLYVYR
jgi:hypothetical protein